MGGNSRMRGLPAAVEGDEPMRKAEAVIGAGPQGPTGKSAYQIALENGFVGTEVEWLASLNGTNGSDGTNGASAYQIAVANGFVGSETAWLESIKGEQGERGLSFYQRRVHSASISGAYTCDWSLYDEIRLTLTGNVTLTFSGAADGQGCTLKLKQDATGGRTVTLDANVRFNLDVTAYTPTATAAKSDRLGFIRDATDNKYDFVSVIKGF